MVYVSHYALRGAVQPSTALLLPQQQQLPSSADEGAAAAAGEALAMRPAGRSLDAATTRAGFMQQPFSAAAAVADVPVAGGSAIARGGPAGGVLRERVPYDHHSTGLHASADATRQQQQQQRDGATISATSANLPHLDLSRGAADAGAGASGAGGIRRHVSSPTAVAMVAATSRGSSASGEADALNRHGSNTSSSGAHNR